MRLFLYGTLLKPALLARFLGRNSGDSLIPATLRGWRRVVLPGAPYPTIRPARDNVPGAVIDVDARTLARLTAYEGSLYRLVRVAVETPGGKTAAHAWIAAGGSLRPWTPRQSQKDRRDAASSARSTR